MIFEIHLNNTGLLICVEFEINYFLNITLSLFFLFKIRGKQMWSDGLFCFLTGTYELIHVNYGQGQLTMDGGHFCEFIVLLDFEGGVSKCIIIGNSQALRVYSRRYSKRTCILDNQNWIYCCQVVVVNQAFKTKCHTIVENCRTVMVSSPPEPPILHAAPARSLHFFHCIRSFEPCWRDQLGVQREELGGLLMLEVELLGGC